MERRRMFALVLRMCVFLVWTKQCKADQNEDRLQEAKDLSTATYFAILEIFQQCVATSMPSQQFAVDNLQKYIHSPAKTTVGFAPKYTSNRKFFANMLASTAFKETLERDEDELRKDYTRKLRFCCNAVMDQSILREFYDREVDQSKM